MVILDVYVPGLPPSANKLYANVRGRGRIKTSAYTKFVNETKLYVLQQLTGNEPAANSDVGHRLEITIFVPNLLTKSWPRAARFTKLDASNRLKPIEDVVVSIVGIDDSCFMDACVYKRQGPEGFRIHLATLEDNAFLSNDS